MRMYAELVGTVMIRVVVVIDRTGDEIVRHSVKTDTGIRMNFPVDFRPDTEAHIVIGHDRALTP